MNRSARLLLGLAASLTTTSAAAAVVNPSPPAGTAPAHLAAAAQNRNVISGHVFDGTRRPIENVHVELLNDVYTTVGRTKTNGTGRFVFNFLPTGTYKVRVMPYGTDFEEQTKEVTIVNLSVSRSGGTDFAQVDFYLSAKKSANAGPFAAPGAVFAQEVPEGARKLFEKGVVALGEKKDKEGFEHLKGALEIFPDYYEALNRLGTEYVLRGHYEAAYILLTKAIEINPRSYSSTLGLGMAQYQLKRTDEAVAALRKAADLYDKSVNAYLWLGLALMRDKKLEQAEAALVRGNEVSKGKTPEIHFQLARLYGEQKRYKDAADHLELYLKTESGKKPEAEREKIVAMIKQLRDKAAK